ncbi:Uncharacterized protein FWK35_00022292 [Aphis craccivora]|uniref:C2H2-type domain-containing protein n=1 Tax=Aphis craccivora TaxID=307492 RepID=A0A6G0Y5N6_APHCR|nr:Uncharacterized protein FWK35_00022292 [Aphis craccivora]
MVAVRCKHVCTFECTFKSNMKRHNANIHEGVRYSCSLCPKKFNFVSSLSRHMKNIHGIVVNRKSYQNQAAAQRVRQSCELCNSTFHNRSNLSRHALMNTTDFSRRMSLVKVESVFHASCVLQHLVFAVKNVTGQGRVRFSCGLCIATFSLRSSIDTNYSRYKKSQVTTEENVPDIPSELDVIYISSDSEDGEICMKPLNEDSCTTSPTAVNVEKTPIDNSVGTKTTMFNLHPRNPLGVVGQNEYLRKGTKNQSFSTPTKKSILRKLYEEYVKVENIQNRRLAWVSHATSLSEKLNLELRVIGLLMLEIPSDYSTPIDENLIQMLYQDSLICVENIQHHTQYYIFMQLIYGLMKVYGIVSEDLQSHRKLNWLKNTTTILKYFKFTDDTADFMIERMENFI